MDLLVDVGNTRAKMAVADGMKVVEEMPLSASAVADVVERYSIHRAIASVVGAMPDFAHLLPCGLFQKLHLLSAHSPLPITLAYATPHTLGADRIASVVGACALYPEGSLMVVDAGSCITIDYLDSQHVYHGGSILPGIGMKFRAMNTFTEKLPLLDSQGGFAPLVGTTTEESMRSGVLCGTLFELRGFLDAYRSKDASVRMILTGGDAPLLSSLLGSEAAVNHQLLWRGLSVVLNRLPVTDLNND